MMMQARSSDSLQGILPSDEGQSCCWHGQWHRQCSAVLLCGHAGAMPQNAAALGLTGQA